MIQTIPGHMAGMTGLPKFLPGQPVRANFPDSPLYRVRSVAGDLVTCLSLDAQKKPIETTFRDHELVAVLGWMTQLINYQKENRSVIWEHREPDEWIRIGETWEQLHNTHWEELGTALGVPDALNPPTGQPNPDVWETLGGDK